MKVDISRTEVPILDTFLTGEMDMLPSSLESSSRECKNFPENNSLAGNASEALPLPPTTPPPLPSSLLAPCSPLFIPHAQLRLHHAPSHSPLIFPYFHSPLPSLSPTLTLHHPHSPSPSLSLTLTLPHPHSPSPSLSLTLTLPYPYSPHPHSPHPHSQRSPSLLTLLPYTFTPHFPLPSLPTLPLTTHPPPATFTPHFPLPSLPTLALTTHPNPATFTPHFPLSVVDPE